MGSKAFSRVVGRLCSATRTTVIESSHGGKAAKPQLVAQHAATGAARCTMGAQGGKLVSNLELQMRAEAGSTVMIDSVLPVKMLPEKNQSEYGIGIHASAENDALLVITPEAHVPHLDAHTGLWSRYDLSPRGSLIAVQLADLKNQAARPPTVGGRYTSRTRVHLTTDTSPTGGSGGTASREGASDAFRADKSHPHIGLSCSLPAVSSCGFTFAAEPSWSCDWTYGRRFKGVTMGSPKTNVIASVLLFGHRAAPVSQRFQKLEETEPMPVTMDASWLRSSRRRSVHASLGLAGDAHVAVQEIPLREGEAGEGKGSCSSHGSAPSTGRTCTGYSPIASHLSRAKLGLHLMRARSRPLRRRHRGR